MQHKFNVEEPITNKRLLKALLWHYNFNILKKFENFEKFEKEMCTEINSRREKPISKIVNQTHFNCPLPQRLPATLKNYTEHVHQWKANFAVSQCVVRPLDRLLQRNAPYAPKNFTEKLKQLVGWGACWVFVVNRAEMAGRYIATSEWKYRYISEKYRYLFYISKSWE